MWLCARHCLETSARQSGQIETGCVQWQETKLGEARCGQASASLRSAPWPRLPWRATPGPRRARRMLRRSAMPPAFSPSSGSSPAVVSAGSMVAGHSASSCPHWRHPGRPHRKQPPWKEPSHEIELCLWGSLGASLLPGAAAFRRIGERADARSLRKPAGDVERRDPRIGSCRSCLISARGFACV